MEKLNDLKMGQEMVRDAEQADTFKKDFHKVKEQKAKEALLRQWDAQVQLKHSHNAINKLFL